MRYEKEMIAPIKTCLAGLWENSVVVEELGVGYGVADVVVARPCADGVRQRLRLGQAATLPRRAEVQVLRALRQLEGATFDLLLELTNISAKRLRYDVLRFLVSENYVEEVEDKGAGRASQEWVRDLLAERYVEVEVARLFAYKVAWMQNRDLVPNKEASISKVFGTETYQRVAEAGLRILGLFGQLTQEDEWAPLHGRVQDAWRHSFSGKIAGGTSEIQRNIIATRGLGMPKG